jgi:hypothetical protein
VECCEREVDEAGRQACGCTCISVLGQTTRRRCRLLAGYEHPIAIGCSRRWSEAAMLRSCSRVATSIATQALLPGTTGRHQMKSAPHLSSQDGPGRVQLEDIGPTRNRKVVGSNPTSGSISAGQGLSSKASTFGVDQTVATSAPELTSVRLRTGLPTGAATPGSASRDWCKASVAVDGMAGCCRMVEVSESGESAWRNRRPSARAIRHAWLTDAIRQVHAASRQGTVASAASPERQTVVMRTHRPAPATIPRSPLVGFCFPPDVIVLRVCWYL